MTIKEYVERLLQLSSIEIISIEVTEDDESVQIVLEIPETDAGPVIGHRGEALAALQRLVRIVFHDELNGKRLILDINDYRDQRRQQLEEMAHRAAESVLQSGREYELPYLPSYERFIVHSVISEDEAYSELVSESYGEGRGRRLIVRLAD